MERLEQTEGARPPDSLDTVEGVRGMAGISLRGDEVSSTRSSQETTMGHLF